MREFSFPNLWFIVPQTIPQQYLWLSSHPLALSGRYSIETAGVLLSQTIHFYRLMSVQGGAKRCSEGQ
jgi:hypothetical protein